jgi:WD40 repeat protein
VYVRPNLPYVVVGTVDGHLLILDSFGLSYRKEFPHKPEIGNIEFVSDNGKILLGVGNLLILFNPENGESKQLLVLDSKVSCIFFDNSHSMLYVGLWSIKPESPGLLAYGFDGENVTHLCWNFVVRDVVRSVYIVDDLNGEKRILVGSENREVFLLDLDGKTLDTYRAKNRVIKLRVHQGGGLKRVAILSDASELELLRLEGERFFLLDRFTLDSRPKNAFFYHPRDDHTIHMIVTTNSSLYLMDISSDSFTTLWQGDKSQTLLKSLYLWPIGNRCLFVVERRDSSLACYEASDYRKLPVLLSSILQKEKQGSYRQLLQGINTYERVYEITYSPCTYNMYMVTGNGRLLRVRLGLQYYILGRIQAQQPDIIYSNPKDRFRTIAIANYSHDELLFFGGEAGILYLLSATNNTTYLTPPLQEWIYQCALLANKTNPALLVLSEHGLYLYDMELNCHGSIRVDSDRLRCLCWNPHIKKGYIGSETGHVYELKVAIPSLSKQFWTFEGDLSPIFTCRGKVRALLSLPLQSQGINLLVIGSEDGEVYAIDAATKKAKWSYTFGEWVRSIVLVEEDVFAVVGRQRRVDFLSARSGELISQYHLPYETRSVSTFRHLGRIGLVVTDIDSNAYIYTVELKRGKVVLKSSSPRFRIFITSFVPRISSLFTPQNVIRFLITLAGLITLLANLTQILEFLLKVWSYLKGLVGIP